MADAGAIERRWNDDRIKALEDEMVITKRVQAEHSGMLTGDRGYVGLIHQMPTIVEKQAQHTETIERLARLEDARTSERNGQKRLIILVGGILAAIATALGVPLIRLLGEVASLIGR